MSEGSALQVRDLTKIYMRRHFLRPPERKTALRGVTFDLGAASTLGIAGESGSGKSTLARCIAGWESPTTGSVRVNGAVHLVVQEPAASLNPRFTAADIISEPLAVRRVGGRRERARRAAAAMEQVGLPPAELYKRAFEFSGGERQRLAIARALLLEPRLVVLDESFAGLDLGVQAQVARLLLDLQSNRGISLILISHDLSLLARMAGEIAVLERGEIVERASTPELLRAPRHPCTRALVEAAGALSLSGLPS